MDLCVLGPLEVRVDGRLVPIRAGLPRKLLVALVLHLGQRVSTDTLVDILWHDAPPANKANALQILISYLRKALAASAGAVSIETVDRGYRLVADRTAVDAHRLEAVVSGANSGADPHQYLEMLDTALASWRGPPIPEMATEEIAQPELHRLNELRQAALEQRADCLLELGRNVDAAVHLQGLILEHPLREHLYVQLMTALYRSGRQADALAVYERARTILREELGLDPGPELAAMEQAVLRHAPDLAPSSDPKLRVDEQSPVQDRLEVVDVRPHRASYPEPLERLIGRDREVAKLIALMESRRMITLTGPGGAGKTRLAAELASIMTSQVWWVDLATVDSRDGVLSSVASATGVPTQPGDDGSALVTRLGRHDGLLVLDTCERVRSEVHDLVERLLRTCGDMSVLATSRQPLGARTELAWPVPPLSLPHPDSTDVLEIAQSAAVELFVQRAADRRIGFELTQTNCVDVAGVCLLLDGLPLALELAAAHAAALDPATMLRVLEDRLRLLVDDVRDDRQHTLRSTITWSYDLLSAEQATFFERLSCFAGPFPLEGAVAVAREGLQHDGLELLLALTRQSLVAVERDGRYRLLDTIRAFAWERLGEHDGARAAAQRRHAGWYADLLDEAAPVGASGVVKGWRGELRGVMPDMFRALDWCFASGEDELGVRLLASLWWLWPREGVFEEAAAWFTRAKDLVTAGTPMEAALLASSATYAVSRGDLDMAARDAARAVDLFDRFGDDRGLARALIPLGIARWGQGDHVAAMQAHDRAGALFDVLGDHWGSALARVLRARTAFDAGEPDADQRLAAAEVAARRSGDEHVLAAALVQRARSEVANGSYQEAATHAEESLRLNDRHGHREGAMGSLHALALAWLGQHQPERAGRLFLRALSTALAIHHGGATAESLDGLAVVTSREGRWLDAARVLAAAEELRAATGIHRSELISELIVEVETSLSRELESDALLLSRAEGACLDVHSLVSELRQRFSQPPGESEG